MVLNIATHADSNGNCKKSLFIETTSKTYSISKKRSCRATTASIEDINEIIKDLKKAGYTEEH